MTRSLAPRHVPRSVLMRRLGSAVAAVLLGVAVAGCSRTLDMSALDKSIREGLASQLAMPIAAVECPQEARPLKQGDVFTCTARPQVGGLLTVTVTQKDADGNISWEVTKTEGLLDLKKVEAAVVEGLKAQAGAEATVTCGERWRAATPGDTFSCEATTTDGQTATIDVTTEDAEGNVTWKVR